MVPKTKKNGFRPGSTLVGSLTAVAILLVALIGTSSFRYYAALDGRKAAAQTTAARIALMLCESWRGWQGDLTYDPIVHLGSVMSITVAEGSNTPAGFTLLGSYKIILDENEDDTNGADYYASLSWQDVQPGLRALNVVVSWSQRGQVGFENTDKTFTLTIFALTS